MKPTQSLQAAARRLALTTKQASSQYYKGNRTGSMGWHTKWGGYVIDLRKVRTYVQPEDPNDQLTPFVDKSVKTPKSPLQLRKEAEARAAYYGADSPEAAQEIQPDSNYWGQIGGERYLRLWKEQQFTSGERPSEDGKRANPVLLPHQQPTMELVMKAGRQATAAQQQK